MKNCNLCLLILLSLCAIFNTSCDKDDASGFNEPLPFVIQGEDDDPNIEKLATRVGYYYGTKPNVDRIEWTCRAVGQYCIAPLTSQRAEELTHLANEDPSSVVKINEDYFLIKKSRDFITKDDFVSDLYYTGYIDGEPQYTRFAPVLGVSVQKVGDKDKLLKKYSGVLYESSKYDSTDNVFYFDCKISNSEQLLRIADEIYRLSYVNWASANTYSPWQLN